MDKIKIKNRSVIKRVMSLVFAACLLFSSLVLVSCGKNTDTTAPSGMVDIAKEDSFYSFFVPTTWKYTKDSDTPGAYYSNNDASNVSLMTFSAEFSDYSAEDWWESFSDDFQKIYEGFEVISSEETVLGGVAAVKRIFKGTLGDIEYQFLQVTAIRKETLSAPQAVVFTYTSVPSFFDQHADDVAKMIENFKFN